MRLSRTLFTRGRAFLRSGRLFRHSLPNLLRDMRYGAFLGGVVPSPYVGDGVWNSESSDWRTLHALFSLLPLAVPRADDVIVDIGCGKGRTLAFFHEATRGHNRVVGIEINPEVGHETARRFRGVGRVEVRIGDGVELFPDDTSLLYLSNPFDLPFVVRLVSRLHERATRLRELRLVYHNCSPEFTTPFVARGWEMALYPPDRVQPRSALLWYPPAR